MKVVCISDTHGDHDVVQLPQGDVLVHAGDITAHGHEADLQAFLSWFSAQPFEHKIFIAGNHDTFLEQAPQRSAELSQDAGVHYLNDSGVVISGVHFWGSPITPRFFDWSFMRDPGDDIEKHWRMIPDSTDILITHGPIWGVLDLVERSADLSENTGCKSLAKVVERVRPQFHVFGHIHECYGQIQKNETHHINASTMNNSYRVENAPIVFSYVSGESSK